MQFDEKGLATMPAACLPATGPDQWMIFLLLGIAAMLIIGGLIAVRNAKGRIAMFALAPLALLGVAVAAPAAPAQALETAIPNFSFSDTWDIDGNVAVWDATSEDATGQALADMQTLEDMVVEGSATKTASLVASTSDSNVYQFQVVPGSFDDFDFSYVVPGNGANSLDTAFSLLEDDVNVSLVLTFVYTYHDQCNRPLQTTVTYTGLVSVPEPVP